MDTVLLIVLSFLLLQLHERGAKALPILADVSGIAISIALLVLLITWYLKLPVSSRRK